MFYSFEKSGKSHLIVRRTPFNPEDWLTTPTVYIDSDQVISEDNGQANDLKTFTQMLYNWYCENSNFYALALNTIVFNNFLII